MSIAPHSVTGHHWKDSSTIRLASGFGISTCMRSSLIVFFRLNNPSFHISPPKRCSGHPISVTITTMSSSSFLVLRSRELDTALHTGPQSFGTRHSLQSSRPPLPRPTPAIFPPLAVSGPLPAPDRTGLFGPALPRPLRAPLSPGCVWSSPRPRRRGGPRAPPTGLGAAPAAASGAPSVGDVKL